MAFTQRTIIEKVTELAKPVVESMGFELFDVKYRLQGGRRVLTIVIDNPRDYVSTRDCEIVSYQVEKKLDQADFISGSYILEVSSPGLDRPLRSLEDFKRFTGRLAKVKADKTYVGHIKEVREQTNEVVLATASGDVVVRYDAVRAANLEVDF